jgi:hypothetical protein
MWSIIAMLMVFVSATARAKEAPQTDSVNNVLDRLEKRLIDQEAEELSYRDRPEVTPNARTTNNKTSTREKSTKSQKFKKENITGGAPEYTGIQGIGQLVTQLEAQVDQFAQSVQKSTQSIVEEARIDNYIDIEARLSDPDRASITTMVVKLDGFNIYQSQDSSGLWLPSAAIPLYSGPFPPGNHRLDVELRLAKKSSGPLPIHEDVYHFVSKAFDIVVPIAKEKKRYIIQIKPMSEEGKGFDASLEVAT